MIKVLVIADDFTGLLDTGVQFSKTGAQILATTDINIEFNTIDSNIDVLIINTESRYLSANESYRILKSLLDKAVKNKIDYVYKKVDSSLRGNISSEIKALVDTFDSIIPIIPSYPDNNRTLKDGILYIDGTRVSQSCISHDPYEPVLEDNLIRRLKVEEGIEATLFGKESVDNKSNVLVMDAITNEDFNICMDYLEENKMANVVVGSAGFAKIFAKWIFNDNHVRKKINLNKPLVVISGTLNPTTKAQIEYASSLDYPRIQLDKKQLLDSLYWENEQNNKILSYKKLIRENSLVIFDTFKLKISNDKNDSFDNRFIIGESLGHLTKELMDSDFEGTFLFTGGDTLNQSMKVLGINTIKPIDEIQPGIVISKINYLEKEILVITKSGGFGEKDLFVEIVDEMEGTNL